ncbi:hypothetical protein [Sorangium sp. So ce1000]
MQTVADTGRSVTSSAIVVPPAPLHTRLWQSPGVCPDGTSVPAP